MSDKKKDLSKTLFSAGGLFLVLLIIILINVLISQMNFRIDATSEKLYSLSDSSKSIISNIKDPVTLKLFYTKGVDNIPLQLKNFAPRLVDFLTEYENFGKEKVKLEIYNPKPDSDEEEWAQQYGIKGIDLPTGDTIYFGLVVIAADREETLPFVDPGREEHMEYDITHAIAKVQSPKKAKIGLLSGLDVFGNPSSPFPMAGDPPETPPWYFLEELRKSYDVEEMSMTYSDISDDLDLLVLVYPKDLSDRLQYAVDQYVLNGGRVILFVDPFAMSDRGPNISKHMSLPTLFKAWGIKMNEEMAVMDFGYATQFMDKNNQVVENPFWLSLDKTGINTGSVVTSQLESILLSIAGAIEKGDKDKIRYTPLLQSSTNSQLFSVLKIQQDLKNLRLAFKPTNKRYDIAVSLSGIFDTAFPNGPPPVADEKLKPKKPHIAKGIKESTIIVVADTDMINDNNYVEHQSFMGNAVSQVYNDNLNFLLNAAELLAGNQDLINIRSRGKFERPFTKVTELEKTAQAHWMTQEQALAAKFDETNKKLQELESQKDASQKFVVSEEQEKEIKTFREEKLKINKKLKEVRRNLRADIEKLGTQVKFLNIFLMPILISIFGIVYAAARRNKAAKTRNSSK
jgi:ABC-type uncharacterized transport system involved in gliding motility auxiliary subunit